MDGVREQQHRTLRVVPSGGLRALEQGVPRGGQRPAPGLDRAAELADPHPLLGRRAGQHGLDPRALRLPRLRHGFDPSSLLDRAALRAELGYHDDEQVCVVAVGGSGVGHHLLRRVLDAVPLVRRADPHVRFVVVAGPRIDPRSLPRRRGARLMGHVPDLHRHLAASDLAVVQGGLTTCMELTATGRPFVRVPLRHHFEQTFHVRHRLDRYGAGRHLDYEDACLPDVLADVVRAEIGRPVSYRPVAADGAARVAGLLAELTGR